MQVFLAVGQCADHDATYYYTFTDPDQAIEFVDRVKKHEDDAVTGWSIVTLSAQSADEAYQEHRDWVEN